MGVLQNSINTMIGSVGIAFKLSPGAEARAEARAIKRREANLDKRMEVTSQAITEDQRARRLGERLANASLSNTNFESNISKNIDESKGVLSGLEELSGLRAERETLAKEKFNLSPSKESYKELRQAKASSKYLSKTINRVESGINYLTELRQEAARKKAMEAASAKAKQTEEMVTRRSEILNAQGENIMVKEKKNGG